MPRGWTEHDLAQIEKKDGYAITHQVGNTSGNSAPEELMALMLEAFEVEGWQREFRFDPSRRWRFDFAFPEQKLAIEIEGLTHEGGRHQRIAGFEKDCEKYEAAMLSGWRVYRVTPSRVKSGRAVQVVIELLSAA